MAEPLKAFFDRALVASLAEELAPVLPGLDRAAFVRAGSAGLDRLELTGRARHLAAVLRAHLPAHFPDAAQCLVASLPASAPGPGDGPVGMAPFRYLPHVYFAAEHGLDDFEAAMALQHALTQRFTAEFSIRAYLERHPAQTLARLRRWARDPSVHVRRLVSEGVRPRLPWAPRLPAFQADPSPVLALLELLVDDPERYVQRSVANCLGDVGKDHPARAVAVARRWLDEDPGGAGDRPWIVRHGLRTLIKRGDAGALAVIGFGARAAATVSAIALRPARVTVGGEVAITFTLTSTATRTQRLLVDYAVDYVKARGQAQRKVFKLRQLELAPGASATLTTRRSFVDRSTRRHYPGRHVLVALVNGQAFPLGAVEVRPRSPTP